MRERVSLTVQKHTKRESALNKFNSFMAGGSQNYNGLLPPPMTKKEWKEIKVI